MEGHGRALREGTEGQGGTLRGFGEYWGWGGGQRRALGVKGEH